MKKHIIRTNAKYSEFRNGILFSKKTIMEQSPLEPITIWMETVEE